MVLLVGATGARVAAPARGRAPYRSTLGPTGTIGALTPLTVVGGDLTHAVQLVVREVRGSGGGGHWGDGKGSPVRGPGGGEGEGPLDHNQAGGHEDFRNWWRTPAAGPTYPGPGRFFWERK